MGFVISQAKGKYACGSVTTGASIRELIGRLAIRALILPTSSSTWSVDASSSFGKYTPRTAIHTMPALVISWKEKNARAFVRYLGVKKDAKGWRPCISWEVSRFQSEGWTTRPSLPLFELSSLSIHCKFQVQLLHSCTNIHTLHVLAKRKSVTYI